MEARLSCWLVLLSVNITARPGGPVAGFPLSDPSHMQVLYFVIWILLCQVIDRICKYVLTTYMHVLLNLFKNKKMRGTEMA